MRIKQLHKWNLSYDSARSLQENLAEKVRFVPFKEQVHLAAGLDCSLSKDKKRICTGIVVCRTANFEVVETASAVEKADFPYIPGLLSFREAPVCIKAVEKLNLRPDVFIVDGQGIAHPRRLGLAAHLGIFFDRPTIGCAKSRLIGEYLQPQPQKGAYSLLKDNGRTIGAVLRTRTNVKPLFVSVGNLCMLEDAIRITLACTTMYRLPEPTRLAHKMVTELRIRL